MSTEYVQVPGDGQREPSGRVIGNSFIQAIVSRKIGGLGIPTTTSKQSSEVSPQNKAV